MPLIISFIFYGIKTNIHLWFRLSGLWHINLCRLFKAKSIFMWITSSISNNTVLHEYAVCQKHFYFKLFEQLYVTIHFSESTVSMTKTVQFQIIQFNISTQFKCMYSLIVKNKYLSSYSVLIQLIQFSISTDFVYTQLHVETVLCQTIQFSVNTVSMSKKQFYLK